MTIRKNRPVRRPVRVAIVTIGRTTIDIASRQQAFGMSGQTTGVRPAPAARATTGGMTTGHVRPGGRAGRRKNVAGQGRHGWTLHVAITKAAALLLRRQIERIENGRVTSGNMPRHVPIGVRRGADHRRVGIGVIVRIMVIVRIIQCTTSGRRTPGPRRAEPIETERDVIGTRPIEIGQIEIMVPRPPDMTVVARRAMTTAAGRMAQIETPISHLPVALHRSSGRRVGAHRIAARHPATTATRIGGRRADGIDDRPHRPRVLMTGDPTIVTVPGPLRAASATTE